MSSLIFCCQVHTAPPTPKAKKEVEQASTSTFFSTYSFPYHQDTSSFDIVKATQYGAFDRVQEIIESGFDVNERDEVMNQPMGHHHHQNHHHHHYRHNHSFVEKCPPVPKPQPNADTPVPEVIRLS